VARWRRARQAVAAILAAAFAVLLPATITAAWIRGTMLSTSGYVSTVAPVGKDQAVRAAVRAATASEIAPVLSHAAADALPPAATILAGPLSSGMAGMTGDGISRFMASPAFQRLWIAANTSAHSQLISVLNGNNPALATTNGEVVLNLAPLISGVLKDSTARLSTLTGKTISLPVISAVPAASCRQIASLTRTRLPPGCGQIPLFPASALASARRAFRVLGTATRTLFILTPLTAAVALLAAPRRRRVLLQITIGGALTVLGMVIAAAHLQSSLIAREQPRYQPAIAVILHALTSGFFTQATWCVISSGILAAAALLTGPHPWATAIKARTTRSSGHEHRNAAGRHNQDT
jgi:hypothetical protein